MSCENLAIELMDKMLLMQKARREKNVDDRIDGENFALYCIRHTKDPAVPGDISDAMCISTARIANILNSLEKKGYITREIDKNDRRRIIVKLTPEGRLYEEEQERKYVQLLTEMLALLGEQDARDYVRITGKLAGIFSEIKWEDRSL